MIPPGFASNGCSCHEHNDTGYSQNKCRGLPLVNEPLLLNDALLSYGNLLFCMFPSISFSGDVAE
jgi:hypothetical protein